MDKKLHQFVSLMVVFALTFFEWNRVSASTTSNTVMQEHNAGITTSNTYYVSTTGNDANSGLNTSPFKTFAKAVSVLKPGDTLRVMPGIYNEPLKISISGMVDSPITIIGNSAVLDMQGVNSKGI